MPWIILVIIIVEIGILFSQWFVYLTRPKGKKMLFHLFLLLLLIFYNLAEGFFPDKRITIVPILLQNFLGFGFGYIFASYCPIFFWGAMELPALRFHGKYGFLFVLIPVIIFYGLLYPINRDISFTRKYVYIIPAIYAITLFTKAIRSLLKAYRINHNSQALKERILVFLSVFPVSVTPIFGAWLGLDKWIITTTFNIGFLIVDAIYMKQVVWLSRTEQNKLVELTNKLRIEKSGKGPSGNFEIKSVFYKLTKREIEIVLLFREGLTYNEIAEKLFISNKTVGNHVQNIYDKTQVNNRFALIHKLFE